MTDTLLVITGIGLTPYSARGLKQTLEPIEAAKGHLVRTVNGGFLDLSPPQFRKYKSQITCDDMNAPALDGVFEGLAVTVDCVAELPYPTGGTPNRPVVDDSSREDGAFTFYRPRLDMVVLDWQVTTDEWGAAVGWRLDLEEA